MHPPAKFLVLLLSVQEWAPKRYNGSFFSPFGSSPEKEEGGRGMNELRPAQKKYRTVLLPPSLPPSLLRHYNVTWFEWEDAWWCGAVWGRLFSVVLHAGALLLFLLLLFRLRLRLCVPC